MIKGIIFDKDGTLVKRGNIWVNGITGIIDEYVSEYYNDPTSAEMATKLLKKKLGITKLGVLEESIMNFGSLLDVAKVFSGVIPKTPVEIDSDMRDFLFNHIKNHPKDVEPTSKNLPETLSDMKNSGLKLGIISSDYSDSMDYILDLIKIREYFDFVGTADIYKQKPNVEMIGVFCKNTGLTSQEIIYVGDTAGDMNYAKNMKAGIAVLSGSGTLETLSAFTDFVYSDVEVMWKEIKEKLDTF